MYICFSVLRFLVEVVGRGGKSPPELRSWAIVPCVCLFAIALASGLTRPCGAGSTYSMLYDEDGDKHVTIQ